MLRIGILEQAASQSYIHAQAPGLALLAFPYVKKDLFQQSPGFVRRRVGGVAVVSIVGIITAVAFAW
jgi:hypothetical protein